MRIPTSPLATPPNVYFDDSGCNRKHSSQFLWAGYWASYSFWQAFGDAWNKILDRKPRIEFWHQADARDALRRNPKSPFLLLTDAQITAREESLCRLVFDHLGRMLPISVSVAHADLDAYVTGKITCPFLSHDARAELNPKLLAGPHLIALSKAASIVAQGQDKAPIELRMPVSLHCEDRAGDPYQEHLSSMWRIVRRSQPQRLGSLDFPIGKSRDTPQLQVADMLAWHINRRFEHAGAPDDPMWSLLVGDKLSSFDVTPDELKQHVDWWNRVSFPAVKKRGSRA